MNIFEKIKLYRNIETKQKWFDDENFNYENDYIKVIAIQTSNRSGGKELIDGKQWSIIIKLKQNFTFLNSWKDLYTKIGIRLTPVERGKYKGNFGIRLYNMALNPDSEIINYILDYIFITC